MIGFPLGLVAMNTWEWVFHKYVLHGLAANKDSFWAFHWHEHHRETRRAQGLDPAYEKSWWKESARAKEVLALLGGAAILSPLLPVAPWFVTAVYMHAGTYYLIHKHSHLDVEWARKWVPWHYDHHMGRNQHANWCVTFPLADWILGTREKWAGTKEEAEALERIAARKRGDRTIVWPTPEDAAALKTESDSEEKAA